MARRLQLPSGQTGAVVTDVDPDGPSAGALRQGDVILSVNRQAGGERGRSGARAAEGASRAASRRFCVWRGDGEVFVHGEEGLTAIVRLQIADCRLHDR